MFDQFAVKSRGDKYGTFEEFERGWKSVDPEPDMDQVRLNFKFADANGDGQLSREEFMTLRNVVGSHYIDGFMAFDADSNRKIDLGEFANAYRAMEPEVQYGLIYTAYLVGDTNKDKTLDFDEWHLLAQISPFE